MLYIAAGAVAVILACIAMRALIIAALAALVIAGFFALGNALDATNEYSGWGAFVPAAQLIFPACFVVAGIAVAAAYGLGRMLRKV